MLKRLGRWAAGKVHGSERSSEGYLIAGEHYLLEEQEWRVGLCYLGLFGILIFAVIITYMIMAYDHYPRGRGNRIILGEWSELPLELKILMPLAIGSHLTGMGSAMAAWVMWLGVRAQLRSDLFEEQGP